MVTLLVTISFMVNALLGGFADTLWNIAQPSAVSVEPNVDHPDHVPSTIGSTNYLIVGMGRAGRSAYDTLKASGQRPLGIESDPQTIQDHLDNGRRVIYGDSQDNAFWESFDMANVKAILLLIPDASRKITATKLIREQGYEGQIHALVRNDDDIDQLIASGVDQASQPISRAGRDMASEILENELKVASAT